MASQWALLGPVLEHIFMCDFEETWVMQNSNQTFFNGLSQRSFIVPLSTIKDGKDMYMKQVSVLLFETTWRKSPVP